MTIDDILTGLSELDADHYLVIRDEEGVPNIFRPINQSTEASLNLLTTAVDCELEVSSKIHSYETIQ